ncbi:MAG: ATP-binding protein, partial [Bacteroidetes bacterium]|nr:ATP-binding protein [Bacteroidota bacterium]MBT6835774.1 ATP-binding protein [Bacteroidota bacterium]
MAYKRFFILIILRIAIIVAIAVFATLLFMNKQYITVCVLLIVLIGIIISLIQYINRTNYSLNRFFESIKNKDLTQSFNENEKDVLIRHLHKSFNQIIEVYKEARIEKESQHNFLKTLVEHLGVGLISFDEKGEVDIFNKAAQNILNMPYLPNISLLDRIDSSLSGIVRNIQNSETRLVKIQQQNELKQLSIRATEMKMENNLVKLVSIQDIKSELDAQELGAWQKLIRVLTHEIMNSISPITSLSSTISQMLETEKQQTKNEVINPEVVDDVLTGLKTISKRSKGLISFVDTYRNLTRIPTPVIEVLPVNQLLDNVHRLMEMELAEQKIKCMCTVNPESLQLKADEKLLEQVIINLVKNSIQALDSIADGVVDIRAFMHKSGQTLIQVRDNGIGMNADIIDEIYTPFFTTREKGSGIGLSISRQIMQLHGGSISVISAPGEGTVFTLSF